MRAYPYDRWARMSREEASALRGHARGGPLGALARGAPIARAWLGVLPRLMPVGPAATSAIAHGPDPIVAVLLEDARGARAALVIDVAMASLLVDRTLGGDGAGLDGASGPLREVERGVLAYAFARWLAGVRSSFAVAAVLSSTAALAEALGDAPRLGWPLAFHLGEVRGRATLWAPDRAEPIAPSQLPSWVGALPVEVVLSAGTAVLSAREIASLAPRDVVVPDRCELRIEGGALRGGVSLQADRASYVFRLALEADGLRVLGGELGTKPSRRGAAREGTNVKDGDRVLEKVGDTPVALSVELARFVLPLTEIAALTPGEVLRTGTPIGERVALRAGDRIVATGELVDVEGEIGVRILELPE